MFNAQFGQTKLENPTITCPSDITIYGDSNCDFVLADYTSSVSATDNCTVSPLINFLMSLINCWLSIVEGRSKL